MTKLGAANHFKIEHLQTPELKSLLDKAKVNYISGFFLTVSPPSALHVFKQATAAGKINVLSLAAPFICQFFDGPLKELIPYADYVVGNEHEGMAFGAKWGFGTTQEELPEIAKKLCDLPKENRNRSRTVIFTQGPGDALIVRDGVVRSFPVIPCPKEDIVDLNGAGDAWLGGFLSQLVHDKPLEVCVAAANYAANVVIKRAGCSFPEKPSFDEKKALSELKETTKKE